MFREKSNWKLLQWMVKWIGPAVNKHRMTQRRESVHKEKQTSRKQDQTVSCFVPLCAYQWFFSRNVQLRRWSGSRILGSADVSRTVLYRSERICCFCRVTKKLTGNLQNNQTSKQIIRNRTILQTNYTLQRLTSKTDNHSAVSFQILTVGYYSDNDPPHFKTV